MPTMLSMRERAERDAGWWRNGGVFFNLMSAILLVIILAAPLVPHLASELLIPIIASAALTLYVAFNPLEVAKSLIEAADRIDLAQSALEAHPDNTDAFIAEYEEAKNLARRSIKIT